MSDSSFSSESEDDRRKQSTDSDDSVQVKKTKKTKTVSKATLRSDSDDSESSDNETESKVSNRKRSKPASSTENKAKRRRPRPQSDSDSEDEKMRQWGAADLNLSEQQRREIFQMTEKQREEFLFEMREKMEREQTEQRLKAKAKGKKKVSSDTDESKSSSEESEPEEAPPQPKKKAASPVRRTGSESEDFDAEFQRPSEMAKKKQQKSALSDLLNRRREKEKKEAKKAALAVDAVFGKDKSDDESDSSSTSSSSPSSRSSSPSSRSSRARSATPDQEEVPKKQVESRQELSLARLSRFRMAKFVHAPFFKKTVVGCYVRVGGIPPSASGRLPKIGLIVDVIETAKTYNVEGERTNKGLKLRLGPKDERVIRLEFISNQDFNDSEFFEWIASLKNAGSNVPTVDQLEKKAKEIKLASNHVYTEAEVEQMIAEKKRFAQKTCNFAARKRQLLTDKERAEQLGETQKVSELQRQIQELDEYADRLDRQRQGDIVGVTWINKRNRQQMKEALLGDKKIVDMRKEDDPFTRKSGRMKPVSGSSKEKKEAAAASASASASSVSATPATPATPAVPASAIATPIGLSAKSTPVTTGSKKAHDLFALHAVDIDLGDLDIGKSARATGIPSEVSSMGASSLGGGSDGTRARGRLSLEEYKKRRQNLAA